MDISVPRSVSLIFNKLAAGTVVLAMVVSMFPAGLTGFNFASADDSGFLSPTVKDVNHDEWSNADRAFSSNNNYSTETDEDDDQSFESFGFSVPSASTINGVEVSIEGFTADPSGCQAEVRMWSDSDNEHSDYRTQSVTDTEGTYVLGGSSDLWGSTWIPSDFSNADFHVEIRFDDVGSGTCDDIDVENGGIDINHSGSVSSSDDGSLGGKTIIDGRVDWDNNGVVNGSDDSSANAFLGKTIIDGWVDFNGSGTISGSGSSDDGELVNNTFSLDHIQVKVHYTPDACNDVFTYEKESDYSDARVAIDFHGFGGNEIDVSAQTGYEIQEVWLDVEGDGESGYYLYATGPVDDFNPPGGEIDEAKIIVKKTCNGVLEVKKVIVGGHDGDDAEDFSFTVATNDSVTVPQSFEADGQNDLSLAPDTYTVTETAAAGWVTTYENCSDVSLALGETETCTITNTRLGSITIVKETVPGEVDQDFVFTTSEGLAEGNQFTLNTSEESQVTFSGLEAGEYSITETEVPGYVLTNVSCVADGAEYIVEDNMVSIGLSNTTDVVCTFTNKRLPMLTVYKYASPLDTSFDITVENTTLATSSIFTADVAGDGEANSGNTYHYVALGDYTLTETLPEGWGANGTGGVSSSVCYKNGDASDMDDTSISTSLAYGDVVNCIFNNTPNSILAGDKFEDMDGKGESTEGDGLSGWTIRLFEWDGDSWDFEDDTTTDAGGMFNFGNIQPGKYLLCEQEQSSWYQSVPSDSTTPPAGAVVTSCINDVTWGSAKGYRIEIVDVPVATTTATVDDQEVVIAEPLEGDDEFPGQVFDGFRFGNYQKGSIGGIKWNDEDSNGVLCTEEMDANDECTEEQAPDNKWYIAYSGPYNNGGEWTSAGTFSFTNLEPGTYTLSESMQSGWAQTYPYLSTGNQTHTVVVQSGDHKVRNFGNVGDSTISGEKWNDVDGDGVKDEGETTPGTSFTFELYKIVGETSTLVTTQSDNDGYTFSGLLSGTYMVCEVETSGWEQTYPADDGCHTVTVGIDQDSTDNDFGNIEVVDISGMKYHDKNRNGVKDEGEFGLSGWTITATPIVDSCNDGCWEEDTDNMKTTTTDSDGNYVFHIKNSETGTWRIAEVNQSAWTQTAPTDPSYYDTQVSIGDPSTGNNFGNWKWPVIQVYKWTDLNSNGTQDEGEGPVAGYPIAVGQITGSEGGEEGADALNVEIITTELTGSDGFANIALNPAWFEDGLTQSELNNLVVFEGQQSNWTKTFPNFTHNDTINITWRDGLIPITLLTDSFFDVFTEGIFSGGGTATAGLQHDTYSPETSLKFGNHYTEPVTETPSTPTNGGGGGGGNGPIAGSLPAGQVLGAFASSNGQVLGESACSAVLLTDFMRRGKKNDPEQVKLLQEFLNKEMGLNLPVTGFFGPLTENAVKSFQIKYAADILTPWNLSEPTGFVYLTTLRKINQIHCEALNIPMPELVPFSGE